MGNTRELTQRVKSILDEKPALRQYLFVRGFLMSSKAQKEQGYPFYGAWTHTEFSGYHFYVHPEQKLHIVSGTERSCFLIGHAYNPFTMEYSEGKMLQQMADSDRDALYRLLNELTGVFTFGYVEHDSLTLISDCAGMQIAYYGEINGDLYVSTHMQLLGDLLTLPVSDYVERLIKYRFYPLYGAYLPGDLSSYEGVRRIVPNTEVIYKNHVFQLRRFYPVRDLRMCKNEVEYDAGIQQIAGIMRNTMELISQKWERPAISLSGGMDSKGSLAAANGIYDRFYLFSYISMPGERIDAEAAAKLAQAVGANHHVDYISDNDDDFPDIEDYRVILEHNFGNIGKTNKNDVRKRVFYTNPAKHPFDIEAKSWVSEVGRANYYKKFGLSQMPKRLSPRHMTTMYKFFLHNRSLMHATDRIFRDYIRDTHFDDIYNYDASDMFLWEMRYGSWGGQVITCEHRFAFNITVPYNNRRLMEIFLTLPLEKRISDQAHYDMIRVLNPKIDATGITITNYNETKSRMRKERLYYLVNTHFPF